jgi:hypothetical protein
LHKIPYALNQTKLIHSIGYCNRNDKIKAGKSDDTLTGNGGADKFKCGSGNDEVTDYNPDEGDKATDNYENVVRGNGKK